MLAVVAQGMERFSAQVLAHCRMSNHHHFVLHTRMANLSLLMRHIDGATTQDYNRRRAKVGQLFHGRFKAILVDRDAYLLELCRYIELNSARAGMVDSPQAWAWSSYRAHVAQTPSPEWLDTEDLRGYLLGRPATTESDMQRAATLCAGLVAAGRVCRCGNGH